MQTNKKDRLVILLGGLFLILTDQTLKYAARANQNIKLTWKNLFGWEFFANPGIAFNIPFPSLLITILTPLIILGLALTLIKKPKQSVAKLSAIVLIIAGALSNYIDRILFGITIDYLRLFTSIINLADVMIIAGVVILLSKRKYP